MMICNTVIIKPLFECHFIVNVSLFLTHTKSTNLRSTHAFKQRNNVSFEQCPSSLQRFSASVVLYSTNANLTFEGPHKFHHFSPHIPTLLATTRSALPVCLLASPTLAGFLETRGAFVYSRSVSDVQQEDDRESWRPSRKRESAYFLLEYTWLLGKQARLTIILLYI